MENDKKLNRVIWSLVVILAIILVLILVPQNKNKYIHVGIAAYNMEDEYLSDMIYELENQMDAYDFGSSRVVYEIFDAEGSVRRQDRQLQYMCQQDFDVLIVNLVKPSLAANFLNMAANNEKKVILFNREVDEKDMSISDNIWYVGTDGYKAGEIQGKMIVDAIDGNIYSDSNGNGKIDYILVEGEPTHFDSIRRTKGFLESTMNLPMNQLEDISADWSREMACEELKKLDRETVTETEIVVCNNDDMALGVADFYSLMDMEPPIIIGINNTVETGEKIKEDIIYGTVDNDIESQIERICTVVSYITAGKKTDDNHVWYSIPIEVIKNK